MKLSEWLSKQRKPTTQIALDLGIARSTLWKCINDHPVTPDVARRIYEGTRRKVRLKDIVTKPLGRPRMASTQGSE